MRALQPGLHQARGSRSFMAGGQSLPPPSDKRRLPHFQGGLNLEKPPFARLPHAWLVLRARAEAGGAPGVVKVIYGECPACIRRVIVFAYTTEAVVVYLSIGHFTPAQPELPPAIVAGSGLSRV